MKIRVNYVLLFISLLVSGVCVSAQTTKQKEIVVVEGDKYIFSSSFRTKYSVSRNRIAASSNNGTVTARRPGRALIKIASPSGVEEIKLRVVPKREVSLKGEFPIMAWYSLQEDLSKERFKELAGAGFNVSFSYATDSIVPQMQRAIKAVEGTGIKLLIPFRGPWVDIKSIVEDFIDNENLWGWYIADEPSFDKFGEVKHFKERVRSYDSTHPLYINLFPTYAPISSFPNGDYEQYVSKFVDQFSGHLQISVSDMM